MRCSQARRLMVLYREGELPAARRVALRRHYGSCAECAREEEHIPADFAPLDDLRRMHPLLDNPDALTLKIMREIDRERESLLSPVSPPRPVERLLAVVRLGGAFATGALLLLYVALTANDARTLASLEKQLAQGTRKTESAAEQLAREASSQLDNRRGIAPAEAGLRPDEAAHVLLSLFRTHREPARVTVEDLLLRKYSALASVTLQDGLDDRERTILESEGERFLKDLEKLIRKENRPNER